MGAVVAMLVGRAPPTVPPASPVVDLAPIEAVLRELQSAVRPAAASTDVRPPAREPVADGVSGFANRKLDAAVQRVVAAFESLAVRLEKLVSDNQRSAQLAAMVREMAELPRGLPASREALDQLSRLGERASREVAYATPAEILQRFGGPDSTGINGEDQVVWWSWEVSRADGSRDFYVSLRFLAGRVVGADVGR